MTAEHLCHQDKDMEFINTPAPSCLARTWALLMVVVLSMPLFAQTPTQTIRGRVLDAESGSPVEFAVVAVKDVIPMMQAESDTEGRFTLRHVPIGRQVLQVAVMGYKPLVTTPLMVLSAKELVLDIELEPEAKQLTDAIVKGGNAASDQLNNEMTTLSARTFDAAMAERFAGSRADPARMATNFAGVSGANDGRNDIIIRGNSPSGLLWRLEGVDIPSPNHFNSFGSTGGPVGMLNNNTLAKSDFMTSAFPATYGNAISGAFDLNMRNGNDQEHEFLTQIGFNGFELGAEGPIDSAGHSSYLVNYRYSTLQAFQAVGLEFGTGAAVPKYQDLSFKLNFPMKGRNRITFFGLAGASSVDLLGSETDFSERNDNDLFGTDTQDIINKNATGIAGASWTKWYNENISTKLTVAATYQQEKTNVDSLTWSTGSPDEITLLDRDPVWNSDNEQRTYVGHLQLRDKINARNTITAGVVVNYYDVSFMQELYRLDSAGGGAWDVLQSGAGTQLLGQAYASWKHHFTEKLALNIGLHGQYHDLSNAAVIEPRAGLSYKPSDVGTWSVAYGLHSQLQPLPVYFNSRPDGSPTTNADLGFTRSHHSVLAYDRRLGANWRVKLETYCQWLFEVPVERDSSSFTMLNTGADFGSPTEDDLVNEGNGRNYGIEMTVERTFSKGFYSLFTVSIFKSEARASDMVWRSTTFDAGYVINALAGREWKVGKRGNNISLDLKGTFAGGRRYTPIDLDASVEQRRDIRDESRTNELQYDPYFRVDVKLFYRMQRKRVTHELGIDLQNITGTRNIYAQYFDDRTQEVVTEYQLGFFPIPLYRLLF
ncbi:MAG: TonB-dependent receptor [Flavobacteriales bacterium]|nr:TonB-dependent receptor [Flavobacteriales bacterium]